MERLETDSCRILLARAEIDAQISRIQGQVREDLDSLLVAEVVYASGEPQVWFCKSCGS